MNTEAELLPSSQEKTAAPSADFIQAISHFLDTDPTDMLAELGYYSREESSGLVPADRGD